jgi:uncharacterized protein
LVEVAAEVGAVLAPGYGGTASQPILVAMETRLLPLGVACRRITFSSKRSAEASVEDVRRARDALGATRVALIGRSFGGRMCARLAAVEPPAALVLLGHPIAPPGRPRPDDEAALARVACPTLVVQGGRDALGPLEVLRRIAALNPRIELSVLDGVGHQFGARQNEAIERAAAWLARVLQL